MKWWALVLLPASVCFVVLATLAVKPREPSLPSLPEPVAFADPGVSLHQLMLGIYAAQQGEDPPESPRIRALIVPHHLTATESIAAGVRMLRHQDFSRILLISPDHFDRCPTLLCTVNGNFKTAFGDVRAAPEVVRTLLASPLVTSEPDLFRQEHGIYAVLPYLAHERPGVPVTPLVVSQKLPWKAERRALLDLVSRAVDDRTLVVVSSDFSHYLAASEAEKMDEATAETLFARDLDGLVALKSPAQSDCPNCLWTLAALADARSFYNPSTVMHTNSAVILDDPHAAETTSHFSMAWYENARLDGRDLAVAGDVTVTRGAPAPLSAAVRAWWAGDGPRLVNLEGPLAGDCPPKPNPYLFCNLEAAWLGIRDLATHWGLVNNHALDRGPGGVAETERIIRLRGETPITAAPWANDSVRLWAVTDVMNPVGGARDADVTGSAASVLGALGQAAGDKLNVVLVHGGEEYRALTGAAEDKFLERFIEAGADAVVVSHSHLVGDMRVYRGKPIFRGLGNFVFDQRDRLATSTAKLVRLRKDGGAVLFETLTSL